MCWRFLSAYEFINIKGCWLAAILAFDSAERKAAIFVSSS